MTHWPIGALAANAALVVLLALLATECLYRLTARRNFFGLDPSPDNLVGQLLVGTARAWPLYFLIAYLFVSPEVAWPALITAVATVSFLPLVIGDMLFRRELASRPNIVLAAFFLLACAMLLASGIGLDRRFTLLDAHFIFTTYLLCLWWGWQERTRMSGFGLPAEPSSGGLGVSRVVVGVILVVIYHAAAVGLIGATTAVTGQLGWPTGIVLGLIVGGCWVPASVRMMGFSDDPGNALLGRSLAAIYLMSAAVLLTGMVQFVSGLRGYDLSILPHGFVDYPYTLWQMEVILLVLTAIFWLARTFILQTLSRLEQVLLLGIYGTYLALRMYRIATGG
ncbi:MAG: hypothetical protein GXY33_01870 [Phycisphaerae bacterium]|nr:hypothetical protein [Phycisphaerae bacterium]